MFKQVSPPQRNAATNLPAPYTGFDPSSPVTAMRPTAAVVLENFLCKPDGLEIRQGQVDHITAVPKQVDRLFVYAAPNGGEKLFGATADGIYDFSVAGVAGATVIALSNGHIVSTMIATGANNYMLCVNGVDTLKQYDGTTWTSIAAYGGTALPTQNYIYTETYRQRIFFVVRNSLQIEYLAANAIAGAATNYPMGALFRLGGYIVAISVWTIDGGIGPEDNLCVFTNKGEVAVFAGNDPATWALRGVYFAGRPLGETPMYKYGGDVLLLTETGIVPMSTLIQTASIDRTQTVSTAIRPWLVEFAQAAFSLQGWQILSDPLQPFLLINVPSTPVRYQAIMHSQTGSWSVYSGWNAIHFARKTQELYFSDSGGSAGAWKVKRITGFADNGSNIVATMLQAYSKFGYAGEKQFIEVRPYFESAGSFSYNLGWSNDFQDATEYTNQIVGSGATAGIWGTSLWGAALWSGGISVSNDYFTPPDGYSVWKALYLQVSSHLGKVSYSGSDLLLKRGGNF
jgi:hypothetical protein